MSDPKGRAASGAQKADSEFFTVGPPLHAVRSGYVQRAADDAVFACMSSGRDAYLFAPERSGKTSLVAATSARLQNNGFLVATLDLAQIGERDAGADAGRWYYSAAYRLLRQLRIKIDLQAWWSDKSILSHRQRLFEFYIEVLLANTKKPIVVFVDELQCIEGLPFADDLVESIGAVSKARATELDFERLSFALVGECNPDLFGKAGESPFAHMEAIRLEDFSREQTGIFATELALDSPDAEIALDRIYYWTAGQPYLTQKIARALARDRVAGDIAGHVDRIVRHQFDSRSAVTHEPHMSHIHRRVLSHRKQFESVLNTYGRVRKGVDVLYEPESAPQNILLALGLVVPRKDGLLRVRNRLYELVFTARWANENLPLHWRGPAIAAGILLLLTAVPFWYTQLLPKPYARMLLSSTLDLDSVATAHRNLRSFPGHAATADRLFVYQLESRASQAEDELSIAEIAEHAGRVPGEDGLSEQLLAEYWDRQTARALRAESRDAALLSSIEALVSATPSRRRLANALVGRDYPLLIGTAPAPDIERMVFDSENRLLSLVREAQIQQWALTDEGLQRRSAWTVSALEITPLLRRVIVDRQGTVGRLALTINVSHMRLDDLRVRLIAPSGRAVELAFDVPTSVATDEVRFSGQQLDALLGESLAGTWTLSLRDESGGFAGHLVGWNLSLNSQVLEESFERGLDIPEPIERESDNIWLAQNGRFAVARSLQSDSARLWDLAYAQPARTIAVPADERVLGIGGDAETLVTLTQSGLNVWDARSGRRRTTIDVGTASNVRLTGDGQRALVQRSTEVDTNFEVWDLTAGKQMASIAVAGSPALISVDPTGSFLAIADYDRTVRVWELARGELLSQIDLGEQPSGLELAHGGRLLAAVYPRGLAVWRVGSTAQPLVVRRGLDQWHVAFSPAGDQFLAGSGRIGFQTYSGADGVALGPPLGSGLTADAQKLLAFSSDGRTVVTGAAGDRARFWRTPTPGNGVRPGEGASERPHWLPNSEQDVVVRLAPNGSRLAVGDADGYVNVADLSAPKPVDDEPVNYVGHIGRVSTLEFSPDGALLASAAEDGSIRIWDAADGTPRAFRIATQSNIIDRLRFSHSNRYLAALIGQRVLVVEVASGTVIVNRELGEPNSDLDFAADESLYLAGESGVLRRLSVDGLGIWTVENVWRAPYPLRRIRISPSRQMMVIVDSRNVAQAFDIGQGTIGTVRLDLPSAVSDVLFTRSESQVVIRTSRWLHRADVSRSGIHWRAAIPTPEAAYGSTIAFDSLALEENPDAESADLGGRLLLLTRESGAAELARLDFSMNRGPLLFGAQLELAREWRAKLMGQEARRP